jgi:hypothetical protein
VPATPRRVASERPARSPEPGAKEPRPVAAKPPKRAPAGPDLARLEASLARVEHRLRSARFEEALDDLRELRGSFAGADDSPPVRAQRVRLEVLAATAHVAYGDETAARESLARALDVEPSLDLDPGLTPPKLRRAFEAARDERSTAAGGGAKR